MSSRQSNDSDPFSFDSEDTFSEEDVFMSLNLEQQAESIQHLLDDYMQLPFKLRTHTENALLAREQLLHSKDDISAIELKDTICYFDYDLFAKHIFQRCVELKQSQACKHKAHNIFKRFIFERLRSMFLKAVYGQYDEPVTSWDQIIAKVAERTELHILSSIQIASKMLYSPTSVRNDEILGILQQSGHSCTIEDVARSELEVLNVINFDPCDDRDTLFYWLEKCLSLLAPIYSEQMDFGRVQSLSMALLDIVTFHWGRFLKRFHMDIVFFNAKMFEGDYIFEAIGPNILVFSDAPPSIPSNFRELAETALRRDCLLMAAVITMVAVLTVSRQHLTQVMQTILDFFNLYHIHIMIGIISILQQICSSPGFRNSLN